MEIFNCDSSTWDEFVDRSPEGTVFSKSYFLECYGKENRYLLCRGDHGRVLGGIALTVRDGCAVQNPFQVYNGFLFSDLSSEKAYKQIELRYSVLEVFAEYLFPLFEQFSAANHVRIQDVRALDWYHYHEREKGYYKIRVIYTSLLDIHPERLFANCKGVRVNSFKTSQKHGLITRESVEVEALDRLHALTFERQGIQRPSEESKILRSICNRLIQEGAGKLFLTYKDEVPVSGCFLGHDQHRAYYVFGASDPEHRKTESGTRNLFDAFQAMYGMGVKEVDLVGVNSPQRGGFKMSFGGNLVPFYWVGKVTS